MTYNTGLDAKVAARNEVNIVAMALYDKLRPIFEPYLGKKVENADGTLVAKLREKVKEVSDQFSGHPYFYRGNSRYSIYFTVKSCKSDQKHCSYMEESVYICEISTDGIMTKIMEPCKRVTNYTAAEIEAIRLEITEAQRVLSNAQSRLGYFGTHDNH